MLCRESYAHTQSVVHLGPGLRSLHLHDAQVRGEFEVCKGKALGDDLWQTFGASWQRGSAGTEVAVCS